MRQHCIMKTCKLTETTQVRAVVNLVFGIALVLVYGTITPERAVQTYNELSSWLFKEPGVATLQAKR